MHHQDRPDKAFTTERTQKAGKANAASGKIFVMDQSQSKMTPLKVGVCLLVNVGKTDLNVGSGRDIKDDVSKALASAVDLRGWI